VINCRTESLIGEFVLLGYQ